VIHRIERRGGHILVEASDNVLVTKVRMTDLDEEGRARDQVRFVVG
jgi:hypothetical protein